jgi:hypothetical protein
MVPVRQPRQVDLHVGDLAGDGGALRLVGLGRLLIAGTPIRDPLFIERGSIGLEGILG